MLSAVAKLPYMHGLEAFSICIFQHRRMSFRIVRKGLEPERLPEKVCFDCFVAETKRERVCPISFVSFYLVRLCAQWFPQSL